MTSFALFLQKILTDALRIGVLEATAVVGPFDAGTENEANRSLSSARLMLYINSPALLCIRSRTFLLTKLI